MWKSLLASTISVIILDLLWLRLVAVQWYQNTVMDLLRVVNGSVVPRILPWLLFYVVILVGLNVLIIIPTDKCVKALWLGALAGLMTYGTYALTCLAVYKDWTWGLALGDIIWGMVLCSVVCCVGVYFKNV